MANTISSGFQSNALKGSTGDVFSNLSPYRNISPVNRPTGPRELKKVFNDDYFLDLAEELLRTFSFEELLEYNSCSEEEALAFMLRKGMIKERGYD